MCIIAQVASLEASKVTGRMAEAARANLKQKIKRVGGCSANICFAIDGSGSITRTEFENQKNFILDVASVISVNNAAKFAAVQYATSVVPIIPLTANTAIFDLAVT
eukprot:IDg2252t1